MWPAGDKAKLRDNEAILHCWSLGRHAGSFHTGENAKNTPEIKVIVDEIMFQTDKVKMKPVAGAR